MLCSDVFLQLHLSVFESSFLRCLLGRLAFCVWAIGVESDEEWVKEREG